MEKFVDYRNDFSDEHAFLEAHCGSYPRAALLSLLGSLVLLRWRRVA